MCEFAKLNFMFFCCLIQLKKDKERLQAMMAHLKSSEPKTAAQPVSTPAAVPVNEISPVLTVSMLIFCVYVAQVNLGSNLSFSQATLPKGPPPMSLSQSATAPSTPLMPLSESPSVLTPNSMFTATPVRRRYSRSVSQGTGDIMK